MSTRKPRTPLKKQRRMAKRRSSSKRGSNKAIVKGQRGYFPLVPTIAPKSMFVKLIWTDVSNITLDSTFSSADHATAFVVYSMVNPGTMVVDNYGGATPSASYNQAAGTEEWAFIYNIGMVRGAELDVTFTNTNTTDCENVFIGAYPTTSIKSTLSSLPGAKSFVEQNPEYFSNKMLGLAGGGHEQCRLKRFWNNRDLYASNKLGNVQENSTLFVFSTLSGSPPNTTAPPGSMCMYVGFQTATTATETSTKIICDIKATLWVEFSQRELEQV